jgi:hypothetical protein
MPDALQEITVEAAANSNPELLKMRWCQTHRHYPRLNNDKKPKKPWMAGPDRQRVSLWCTDSPPVLHTFRPAAAFPPPLPLPALQGERGIFVRAHPNTKLGQIFQYVTVCKHSAPKNATFALHAAGAVMSGSMIALQPSGEALLLIGCRCSGVSFLVQSKIAMTCG